MSGPSESISSKWFVTYKRNPSAELRLFCFPFGGGNTSTFHSWPGLLSNKIEVLCVSLPGRGMRMGEKPLTSLNAMLDGVKAGIEPLLDKPFAFFGHSMGALLAFELARDLQLRGLPCPRHAFFSAYSPPHLPKDQTHRHKLPDAEFVENLGKLNGIPKEIADNPEALELLLPLLRADVQAYETHVYREGPVLACSASAFGGLQDPLISREKLEQWRQHVGGSFVVQMFPGGHFFIHSARDIVVQQVARKLEQLSSSAM